MYCIYCGKELKDDYRYCVSCGKSIKRGSIKIPGRNETASQTAASNQIDFEPLCSQLRRSNPRENKARHRTKESIKKRRVTAKKARLILMLCSVFVLVVAVSCYILLNSRNTEKEELLKVIDQQIQSEFVIGDSLPEYMKYNNSLLSALKYNIVSFNRKDKEISLCCTYVDALKLAEMLSDVTGASEYYVKATSRIDSASAPVLTQTIKLKYSVRRINAKKEFSVVFNDDFFNVLSGGAYYGYLDMLEGEVA